MEVVEVVELPIGKGERLSLLLYLRIPFIFPYTPHTSTTSTTTTPERTPVPA